MSDVGAMETEPLLTAGAMLKAARQAQGLHIAVLATQLKVAPRKLEALEADRYDDLQGPTFVRALAQATCRALRLDAAPILARLPAVEHRTLDQVGGGLNAPYRERGSRHEALEMSRPTQWVVLAVLVLLLGAVALWFAPQGGSWPWQAGSRAADATETAPAVAEPAAAPAAPDAAASAAVAPSPAPVRAAAASAPPVATPAMAATPAAIPTEARPAAVEPARVLQVRIQAESWVDVVDATGLSLVSRTLQPGEVIDLDGALPLRVKIGNAAGTQLIFRGQSVDLAAATRDNVARLELK